MVYLSGLTSTGLGILILLSRYQVAIDQVLLVSLLGAGIILFGLLTVAVASSLSRGSGLSRLLVTIYLGVQITLHLTTIITTDVWDWYAAVQLALEIFVVAVVWLPPASRYFRPMREAHTPDMVIQR
nr:hypothetical protein [Microbacterium endophyticum]